MAIPEMNVDPERVIGVLKRKLVDAVTESSLLESALEGVLEREAQLIQAAAEHVCACEEKHDESVVQHKPAKG